MIKTDEELDVIQTEVDKLLEILTYREHTEEEQEKLNYLENLIYQYESQHIEIEDIYGKDMIKFLLEDGCQLSLQDYEWVFNLVNNNVELNESILERLSNLFHVSPLVFLSSKKEYIYSGSNNVFEDIGFPNAKEMLEKANYVYQLSKWLDKK